MLTPNGPKVLEFNCRFGDPEAQVLIPLLNTDLVSVIQRCVDGTLSETTLDWHNGAAATVVLASPGYPGSYPKGLPMTGVDEANALADVHVYHAGTRVDDGRLVTAGGRVVAVTGRGSTLSDALRKSVCRRRMYRL